MGAFILLTYLPMTCALTTDLLMTIFCVKPKGVSPFDALMGMWPLPSTVEHCSCKHL